MYTSWRTALLGAVLVTAAVWLAAAPGAVQPYDTTVMVVDTGTGMSEVAVAYDRVLEHEVLRKAVAAFGRATGAKVTDLSIREETLPGDRPGRATSVDFRAAGLLRAGAPLPIAALAESLPGWGRMRVAFFTSPGFRPSGPAQGEAGGGSYRLASTSNGYQYDVTRADRGLAGVAALETPAAGSTGAGRQGRGLGNGIRKVLIGMAALLALLAAWVLWRSLRETRGTSRG